MNLRLKVLFGVQRLPRREPHERRKSILHYRLYGYGMAGSTPIRSANVDKGGEILWAINRDGIFRLGLKARL
jgi:hypothetical protein